jgi:hypothetical protein
MADDINKRREALQAELNLQQMLTDAVKTHKAVSNQALGIKESLIEAMQEEKDLADKINDIDKAIGDLLLEQVQRGEEVNQHYIEQLNGVKEILKLKQKEKETEDELLSLRENAKDALFTSLGTMGDMLKAGTALGAAMALFNGLSKQIGDGFKNTIGFASELTKELGISGGEAARLGFQNLAPSAMFSRYSIEELNQATKDFVETMGTSAGLTNDLRNSMAELTKMGVGGAEAAKMAQSMESAGGSAVDMTTSIKEMAQDSGVLASGVFKDMASQQRLMVGMTEKEINLLAKKTIELHKQGVTLDDMHGIADSMMDIESTMKAQAKARVMLQGKLTQDQIAGMSAMTSAALEYQRTGDTSKLTEALKQTNMTADKFNELGPRGQEIYAQAIGMTADKLSEVIQKQEQAKKIEESGALGKAAAAGLELWERVPGGIKEATTGLIAYIGQMAIMNMMQGRGTGLGNLNPFKKKGGGGGSPIETEVPGSDDVAPKAQGSEGGLKSLAEGLKAMGDGKVFAGIGAVALAGPAFIVALPSIPFLLFMGKVKLKALEENFTGLAAGLNSMSTTFMGSLATAAFGLAAIPSILSIPFLLFMGKVKLKALEENFTGLAAGLNSISTTFMGSLALAAFGLAAIPSILSIPFLLFMGKVGLKNLSTNFLELGIGLQMMSSTFMGSLALAAFGLAGGAAILAIPFIIAIALGGVAAGIGLSALATGLVALGTAAIPLGFIGVGLIAALGVAMIPFGIALMFATPAIEAFGNIIIGVMGAVPPIIEAIANGFVTMMGALSMENIGALFLLGPALMLASVGMIAFSAALAIGGLGSFFGGGLIDDITAVAMIGPQLAMAGEGLASITTNLSEVSGVIETLSASLSTMGSVTTPLFAVAAGLYSIAGGLVSVAGAGLLSLPIIGGLMGLAAVAPALQSLGDFFGVGGESSESDTPSQTENNKELIAEIKGLRSDIQSQPILINVDGKTVSRIAKVQRQQGNNKSAFNTL